MDLESSTIDQMTSIRTIPDYELVDKITLTPDITFVGEGWVMTSLSSQQNSFAMRCHDEEHFQEDLTKPNTPH